MVGAISFHANPSSSRVVLLAEAHGFYTDPVVLTQFWHFRIDLLIMNPPFLSRVRRRGKKTETGMITELKQYMISSILKPKLIYYSLCCFVVILLFFVFLVMLCCFNMYFCSQLYWNIVVLRACLMRL